MSREDWDRDITSIRFALRTFKKQEAAFRYVNRINRLRYAKKQTLMPVFAKECSSGGYRYFVAEDVDTFYKKYIRMKPFDRAFYEILRAGLPCRLYFDIEYCRVLNPDRDGEIAMGLFRDVLSNYLQAFFGFGISSTFTPGDHGATLVECDASDDKKFSRHLVVVFPKEFVFRNTDDVGIFVKSLSDRITRIAALDIVDESLLTNDAGLMRQFFFRKKNKQGVVMSVLFIDHSVYKRNKNVRLPLSAKFDELGARHFNI